MNPSVRLVPVPQEQASTLGNLFEFYCHDLSAYFPVRVGIDGRFGYRQLPLYFSGDPTRFAYFTFVDDRLAGFALATRGSPARVASINLPAISFWQRTIESYSGQPPTTRKVVLDGIERDVFELDSLATAE